jgi:2-hydroxychromene-2-carboxylate isomerase
MTAILPARRAMTDTELHCFYSLSSPWAYFAGPQLQDIVRRHRVRLVLKPYDFQAVVPKTGGIPLRTRPEPRRSYHALELDRWRRHLGMPLNLVPKHYPADGQPPDWNKRPGWMVIAAQQRGEDAFVLSHALLRALWAEERDTSDAATRIAIADENGYDGAALQALERSDAVQAAYAAYTDEAVRLGVFGAPTFILDGERFWGQDRLAFVDRALAMRAAGAAAG